MFRIKKSRTVSGLLKNTETGRSVEEENEILITYITRHESTKQHQAYFKRRIYVSNQIFSYYKSIFSCVEFISSPKKDSFGIHFKSFELKPRQSLFGRRLKPTGVRHTLVVIFGLHVGSRTELCLISGITSFVFFRHQVLNIKARLGSQK